MKILLVGAQGTLGRAVASELRAAALGVSRSAEGAQTGQVYRVA